MKPWLKKAFAVEAPEGSEPTAAQKIIVDKVCLEVVKRHMTTPALLFLESFRPLNYIGSQVMHFFQPFVSIILTTQTYQHFAQFLENRNSVDYLCQRIEYFEAEAGLKENLKQESDKELKLNDSIIDKKDEE